MTTSQGPLPGPTGTATWHQRGLAWPRDTPSGRRCVFPPNCPATFPKVTIEHGFSRDGHVNPLSSSMSPLRVPTRSRRVTKYHNRRSSCTIVFMAHVSVAEAARRLGVGVPRIHRRIAAGSLRAERIGSQWVVDELSLLRAGEYREPGRPLSARSAWAIIALAEGDNSALGALALSSVRARRRA